MARIKVTRIFFYDSVPSIGTNCLKEAEWDPETGAMYHTANGKQYVCSFAMVREMTLPQEPVVAEPVKAAEPKVAKVDPTPDPMTGSVKRRRVS